MPEITTKDARRFLERYQQYAALLEYSVELYLGAVANLNGATAAYGTGLNAQQDPARKQDAVLRAMWLSEKLLESITLYAEQVHHMFAVLAQVQSRYELKVLKMRYVDDMSFVDIAQAMGISERNIHNIKNEGVHSVRVILEKEKLNK